MFKKRDISKIELNELNKMVFIFNALNKGWIVKKIKENTYEFFQENGNIKEKIDINDFINNNLSIENLISN